MTGPNARLDRNLLLSAGVFLLPLVWWPGLLHPFSTPKLWLLGVLDLLILSDSGARKSVKWPWLLWPAAAGLSAAIAPFVSMQALLLAVLPAPLFLAGRDERLKSAILWSSVVEAAIAALQFIGLDPLRLAGFQPEIFGSSRMRVYGTLGNPDFVAAWLCATLPLHFEARWRRSLRIATLALHVAAILATGSRVFVLALAVAAAVVLLCRTRPRISWLAAPVLAAIAVWLSPARPLATALEGRLYFARIAAAHLAETPPAGWGPGSFETKFGPWQVQWLREHRAEGNAAAFAGPVDHAHNDWLEFWVEYGPLGIVALLAFCGWAAFRGWKGRAGAIWSAAAILLAISCVDFPFHRPAEWALFWLLMGAVARPTAGPHVSASSSTRRNEECLDS